MGGSHESFRRFKDRSKTSPALYGMVALCFLLLLTDGYDVQAIAYAAPALIKAWSVNKAIMGLVFSVGLTGVMIGAMALTPLADRVGARRVLLGCTAAYAVLTLGTALTTNLPQLMILRLLSGLALGAVMPNAVALVADYAPGRLRSTFIAVIIAGFAIGGSLGGVFGAVALRRFGWPSVFFAGAVAPALLLAPLYLFLPDSLFRALQGRAGARVQRRLDRLAPGYAASPEALAAPDAPVAKPGYGPVRGLFAEGRWVSTALIWLTFFLSLLMLYTLSSWLPTVLTLDGLPIAAASLTASGYQLAGVLGAAIGWLCDRFPPGRVLPLSFLCAGAAVFLITAAGVSPALLALSVAASGFFVVGAQTAANAFVSGFYPPSMRATGLGWALGVGRLGSIVGPLLAGALLKAGVQPPALFQFCAVAGVVAAVAVALAAWRRPRAPSLPLEPETA